MTHLLWPNLGPGDLLEAVLLRVDEDIWKEHFGITQDSDGAVVTGDPVIDKWEREALARRTHHKDTDKG